MSALVPFGACLWGSQCAGKLSCELVSCAGTRCAPCLGEACCFAAHAVQAQPCRKLICCALQLTILLAAHKLLLWGCSKGDMDILCESRSACSQHMLVGNVLESCCGAEGCGYYNTTNCSEWLGLFSQPSHWPAGWLWRIISLCPQTSPCLVYSAARNNKYFFIM